MNLTSILNKLFRTQPARETVAAKRVRRRPKRRLELEPLEDRLVMNASLGVNGVLTVHGDARVAHDEIVIGYQTTLDHTEEMWRDEISGWTSRDVFHGTYSVKVNGVLQEFDTYFYADNSQE